MRDSLALQRVKKHSYLDDTDVDADNPKGIEKTRQEGIYLTLDNLKTLIEFLETHHSHINSVSFMIGKKSAADGGRPLEQRKVSKGNEDEYTVEVLPCKLIDPKTAEFLIFGDTIGYLTIPPGWPFDNDCVTAYGGNQKTPPPSPKVP